MLQRLREGGVLVVLDPEVDVEHVLATVDRGDAVGRQRELQPVPMQLDRQRLGPVADWSATMSSSGAPSCSSVSETPYIASGSWKVANGSGGANVSDGSKLVPTSVKSFMPWES